MPIDIDDTKQDNLPPDATVDAAKQDTNNQEQQQEQQNYAAEIAAMHEQLLRALADAENTRRRANKDVEDARKYAISSLARELLSVADSFRLALAAVPAAASSDPAVSGIVDGIAATDRQLATVLKKFGISQMQPIGMAFDPHFHRVMMEEESPSHPAGTVLKVLQDGYMIQDRLLREALVIVSKGGVTVNKVDTTV